MKVECAMCKRPVTVTLGQWLLRRGHFCPPSEVGTCIAIFAGSLEPVVDEDPDLIPPEDIHVCPRCVGNGEVLLRQDWETGALHFTTCWSCQGSGEVTPEWRAPSTI